MTNKPETQDVREALSDALAALNAAVNWYTPPNDRGHFPLKEIANARTLIRAALAQSDAHAEVIPDCPTDGVAARQGNGG